MEFRWLVESSSEEILRQLYYAGGRKQKLSRDSLEVLTGIGINRLRPVLEDLKVRRLIIDLENYYELSPSGKSYAESKWV